jgi:PAS domain S-box-containing protein
MSGTQTNSADAIDIDIDIDVRRAEILLAETPPRENDALARVTAARLTHIVQGMSEACFEVDQEWLFTFVNDRCETLLRCRREEMLGNSLWTVFSKLVGTPMETHYRRAMSERVPVSCEVVSPIAERWMDVRLFPSGDGLAAFYLDVHQRKQTELALRESESSLTAAQARAQIGSWEIDQSTRIVKWSAEMFRIFGRDSKLGPPRFSEIAQMVHPDDRESFGRGKSATNEQEFRVVRPDGEIRWIEGRGGVVLDEAGQVLRHIGTAQDVTERTQVQLALRASEARYHSTLDSILEACQLVGHDWTYLYLNDAAATHNRRPNPELLGKKMTEVWPGIESTGLFALLRRCMDERVPLHDEVEFTFPDGSKGWFDVRSPCPKGSSSCRSISALGGMRRTPWSRQGRCSARFSTAPTSRASPPTQEESFRSSTLAPSACWGIRPTK